MLRYGLFVSLFILSALAPAAPQVEVATGSFVITFQTQTYQGKYAPRNVLAVWLVDGQDHYVRDLAVYGSKFTTKLARWRKDSGKTKPDATTGATRKQHDELSVVWDGTDAKGKALPDGEYKIRLEYTETNRPGPAFQILIHKGKDTGTREVKGDERFTQVKVRCVGPNDN